MIAVVQRVLQAGVTVQDADYAASIGHGLCVLLCAEQGDGDREAMWMANKIANLRIFRDDQGKMNRSVCDEAGQVLVVSQFTLAGDASRGHRPSFIGAAAPDLGRSLVEQVVGLLRTAHGLAVETGVFGAMMRVSLVNDGPVTIIVRSPDRNDADGLKSGKSA